MTTTAATLKFDGAKAWEHLRQQVSFGPRPAGSAALLQCRRYITAQLTAAGLTPREQPFVATTPIGKIQMANVIATIPGKRPERIVFATHYDTKLFREFRFVGASDGASSTAAVLELARVLKARQNEFTIVLLFLDGEEATGEWTGNDHTYGSQYYVDAAKKDGSLKTLKTLILLDMIGDKNLTIRKDTYSTPWLNDIGWASARKLSPTHRKAFLDEEFAVEDDHIPFVKAGVPSIDIIDLDYPEWHTAQDDLDHVAAGSLQIVGDVVLDALPAIEKKLGTPARAIGFSK